MVKPGVEPGLSRSGLLMFVVRFPHRLEEGDDDSRNEYGDRRSGLRGPRERSRKVQDRNEREREEEHVIARFGDVEERVKWRKKHDPQDSHGRSPWLGCAAAALWLQRCYTDDLSLSKWSGRARGGVRPARFVAFMGRLISLFVQNSNAIYIGLFARMVG